MNRFAVLGFLVGALASIGIIVGLAYAAITTLNSERYKDIRPEPVLVVQGDVMSDVDLQAAQIRDQVNRAAAAHRK